MKGTQREVWSMFERNYWTAEKVHGKTSGRIHEETPELIVKNFIRNPLNCFRRNPSETQGKKFLLELLKMLWMNSWTRGALGKIPGAILGGNLEGT